MWLAGDGTYGALGPGSAPTQPTPAPFPRLSGARRLALTISNGYAILRSGALESWGDNTTANLGCGDDCTVPKRLSAGAVDGIDAATDLGSSFCAIAAGRTFCWGSNEAYTLGVSRDVLRWSRHAIEVPGVSAASWLFDGDSLVCAVSVDRDATCWGFDSALAVPGVRTPIVPAAAVPAFHGLLAGAGGRGHLCIVRADQRVVCYGFPELEDAITIPAGDPTPEGFVDAGIERAIAVASLARHTCVLTEDGEVFCWGANESGQLGDGTTTNSSVPRRVVTLSK